MLRALTTVPPVTSMETTWNQTDVAKGSYGFNVRPTSSLGSGHPARMTRGVAVYTLPPAELWAVLRRLGNLGRRLFP